MWPCGGEEYQDLATSESESSCGGEEYQDLLSGSSLGESEASCGGEEYQDLLSGSSLGESESSCGGEEYQDLVWGGGGICNLYRTREEEEYPALPLVVSPYSHAQTPPTLMRGTLRNFWGLVQNSGKPIRIVACDLEK